MGVFNINGGAQAFRITGDVVGKYYGPEEYRYLGTYLKYRYLPTINTIFGCNKCFRSVICLFCCVSDPYGTFFMDPYFFYQYGSRSGSRCVYNTDPDPGKKTHFSKVITKIFGDILVFNQKSTVGILFNRESVYGSSILKNKVKILKNLL